MNLRIPIVHGLQNFVAEGEILNNEYEYFLVGFAFKNKGFNIDTTSQT
jgi:hypothetical protein